MDKYFLSPSQFHFLFKTQPATLDFLAVFLVLFLISIPLAYALNHYVPRRFKPDRRLFFFFISINTFIPVLGFMLSALGLLTIKRYALDYQEVDMATTDQKELGSEKVAKVAAYGAGWARIRLADTNFSKQERSRALYAINKKITKEVNDINRVLFSDNSDEIRLYAFNIINLQQSKIANSIRHCLEALDQVHNIKRFAKLHKLLANLYWELINLNLTPGQLAEEILDKAKFHAESALDTLHQDGNLWLLAAKIYKASGAMEKYRSALEVLNELDNPPSELYLFLSEVNYQEHQYKMIRYYLSKNLLKYNLFSNSAIIEFWCQHAG